MTSYTIDIVTAPFRTVAVAHFHIDAEGIAEVNARIGAMLGEVMRALTRAGVVALVPAIGRWLATGNGFDMAVGFPFEGHFEPNGELGVLQLGGVECAHVTHRGVYQRLPNAYEALQIGTMALGRRLDGMAPMWEEYFTDPDRPEDDAHTEVYWPLIQD